MLQGHIGDRLIKCSLVEMETEAGFKAHRYPRRSIVLNSLDRRRSPITI